jgi:1-acyl-sn-glycerol-3-phosphate acyltransferase
MSGGRHDTFAPGAFIPRLIQSMGMLILRPWVLFAFRTTVRRARGQPTGACVYASNHRSYFDPPLVGMWQRQPLSYFARANLWDNPFFRFMLGVMYGIPVERENPGLSSMKGAVERLRQGIPVLVFPEGTRTRTGRVGSMRDGPALFARRAGVPVVPVYVHASERCWPRGSPLPRLCGGRMEIRFGRPLQPPEGMEPRRQDAWVMLRLQRWMERQERELYGR